VLRTNLEKLPMEIAGFTGQEDSFPEAVNREVNADKQVYRHYRSPDGKIVDLYIGYYGTAKGGRATHTPAGCLPGAGWGILASHQVPVVSKTGGGRVGVNYILARRGEWYLVLLHWYQTGGKVLATGIQQNLNRLINRVSGNRDDGAFIRVSVFARKTGIQEALALDVAFAEKILELVPQYWPLEQ
jgi:EpsI family protein